jgi:hypothetical protein
MIVPTHIVNMLVFQPLYSHLVNDQLTFFISFQHMLRQITTIAEEQNMIKWEHLLSLRGLLQLPLQVNFWIVIDTCNSSYLYNVSVNG